MHPGIIVVITCTAGAALFITWQRWKLFGRRSKIPLKKVYDEGRLNDVISFDAFAATMNLIGGAYGIDPQKIRLDDSLSGKLAAADAMLPDDSRETLWKSLTESYPRITVTSGKLETVRDILNAVGKTQYLSSAQNTNPTRS